MLEVVVDDDGEDEGDEEIPCDVEDEEGDEKMLDEATDDEEDREIPADVEDEDEEMMSDEEEARDVDVAEFEAVVKLLLEPAEEDDMDLDGELDVDDDVPTA